MSPQSQYGSRPSVQESSVPHNPHPRRRDKLTVFHGKDKVPSKEQVDAFSKDLRDRATIPDHVYKTIDALPITAHPMTQFATGVMALQVQSEFQKAYEKGIPKSKFWEPTYEDCLSLIAQVPVLAAYVYRRIYKSGQIIPLDDSLDYGGNFAHMLGFDNPEMLELMRLYVTIHSDHEGGNVSAHTGHLVASALSDPYLSFAAALNGLAGPLHGLANQVLHPTASCQQIIVGFPLMMKMNCSYSLQCDCIIGKGGRSLNFLIVPTSYRQLSTKKLVGSYKR
ncbi:hypothetical protein Dimus_027332 [Dionaea muscipula]